MNWYILKKTEKRACSSVDRAHGYEPWSRGFDSLLARQKKHCSQKLFVNCF